MAESNVKHVITLGNSIIGVSVLAMPFCFQQCGIALGILMLTANALLTRFNCHLLLKSALICRRKTFENLAFHSFGFHGKLAVETSITAFLLGILISFYVVIGDIVPAIISQMFNLENNPSLRSLILTAVALGVALPLGLLKNISSLGNISALSFCFYAFLVVKIFIDAFPILISGSWWDKVTFWQPNGILQCLPIFALAVSCQTQIFEIYGSLPDPSLGKMNRIIKLAIHLCVVVYVSVGFFGYIAFCDKGFSGNVLVNMPSSFVTQIIKLGFALSVALSFPLVIFPCRTSLSSLLSKKAHTGLEIGGNFIPEARFRMITIGVVVATLVMGILCPNIELVLGLIGSTIGSVICIIFPAIIFIRVTNRNTFERYGAQLVLCTGVFLLVACTHVIVHKPELVDHGNHVVVVENPVSVLPEVNPSQLVNKVDGGAFKIPKKALDPVEVQESPKIEKPATVKIEAKKKSDGEEQNEQRRLEPPIPQEPDANADQKNMEKPKLPEALPQLPEEETTVGVKQNVDKESVGVTEGIKKDDAKDVALQQEVLLKKLEQHQQEQMKLIEEQKHLLEELKAHKETHHVAADESPAKAEVKVEPFPAGGHEGHERLLKEEVKIELTRKPEIKVGVLDAGPEKAPMREAEAVAKDVAPTPFGKKSIPVKSANASNVDDGEKFQRFPQAEEDGRQSVRDPPKEAKQQRQPQGILIPTLVGHKEPVDKVQEVETTKQSGPEKTIAPQRIINQEAVHVFKRDVGDADAIKLVAPTRKEEPSNSGKISVPNLPLSPKTVDVERGSENQNGKGVVEGNRHEAKGPLASSMISFTSIEKDNVRIEAVHDLRQAKELLPIDDQGRIKMAEPQIELKIASAIPSLEIVAKIHDAPASPLQKDANVWRKDEQK